MSIEINGLTKHQVTLLDEMWACDSYEEYDEFLSTLPEEDRVECDRLQRLVLLAEVDDLVASMPLDGIKKMLDKYRL